MNTLFRGVLLLSLLAAAVHAETHWIVPGVIINEDDSHFFGSRTAEDMTLEGLHRFVDQYAGAKVSHLFLCPNAMKTSYRSAVRDAIWELGAQDPPSANEPFAVQWVANAKLLDERGLDPYAIWIARCREKEILPWLSMRMNDVHNVDDPKNYIHSAFWVNHPEYWRVPGSTGSWVDRALDYGHPEVREHNMSLVRELLERYDPDGLELDWMRFGYHFKPGTETEGVQVLNEFMRTVRGLTREWAVKRGHPILLGARVPATPEAAKGLGMDGVAWAKEGLVDILVPTPFWTTSDFDIPIEAWRAAIGEQNKNLVIAAGLESNIRAFPGGGAVTNDIESVRGFAAAHTQRGADKIYLFNYMDPEPIPGGKEAYRQIVENGLSLDEIRNNPRRHIRTFHDTVPSGVSADASLPQPGFAEKEHRLYIGPAPRKNEQAMLVVGLGKSDEAAKATFEATANNVACSAGPDRTDLSPFADVARAVQFTCPAGALTPGYNTFHVKQAAGEIEQKIIWLELRISPAANL